MCHAAQTVMPEEYATMQSETLAAVHQDYKAYHDNNIFTGITLSKQNKACAPRHQANEWRHNTPATQRPHTNYTCKTEWKAETAWKKNTNPWNYMENNNGKHIHNLWGSYIKVICKGLVYRNVKIHSSFAHCHVFPNLYDFCITFQQIATLLFKNLRLINFFFLCFKMKPAMLNKAPFSWYKNSKNSNIGKYYYNVKKKRIYFNIF